MQERSNFFKNSEKNRGKTAKIQGAGAKREQRRINALNTFSCGVANDKQGEEKDRDRQNIQDGVYKMSALFRPECTEKIPYYAE